MNVSLNNGWGIVRTIADLVLKQPEGKYVLVKDPNAVSYIALFLGYGVVS
jgi:translation initiation factor 3 subunit D